MQTEPLSMHQELDAVAALDRAEIEHRLIELRDRDTLTCWDLGRVINDLYGKVKRHRIQRTKDECCMYVADFMDNEARSLSSMRLYARIAETFPKNVERDYPLPFSHFETAARYDRPLDVLRISLELMDSNNGRTVSAEALVRHLEILGQAETPEQPDADGDFEGGAEVGGDWNEEPEHAEEEKEEVPVIARMRKDIADLSECASTLKQEFPSWARAALSLARHADKLLRELQETKVQS